MVNSLLEESMCQSVSKYSISRKTFFPEKNIFEISMVWGVYTSSVYVVIWIEEILRREIYKWKAKRNNCWGRITPVIEKMNNLWLNNVCKNILFKYQSSNFTEQNFPLNLFSINVTKSAVSCGSDHIFWRDS